MKKIVKPLIIMAVGIGSMLFFAPMVKGSISKISTANGYSAATVGIAQTMPLIYIVMTTVIVISAIFGGKAVVEYIKYKKWDDFGNRLKLAYTAKFGGDNLAFNQEIDAMILQCKTLSVKLGDTKLNAENRLRRYAHMVEVPYIIPEEEHMSEVDKTEELMEDTK